MVDAADVLSPTQVSAAMAADKEQEVAAYPEDPVLSSDDENRDEDEDEDHEEFKGWDEGGKSDCGYRDSFHDTLMAIGASIHKVVGEPSERIKKAMKGVGNWFQEASYAARDLKRGEMSVGEVVETVVSGAKEEEDENEDQISQHEEEAEKLETVAEESSKAGSSKGED